MLPSVPRRTIHRDHALVGSTKHGLGGHGLCQSRVAIKAHLKTTGYGRKISSFFISAPNHWLTHMLCSHGSDFQRNSSSSLQSGILPIWAHRTRCMGFVHLGCDGWPCLPVELGDGNTWRCRCADLQWLPVCHQVVSSRGCVWV